MLVTHRGQRMKIRVYLVLVFQLDFFFVLSVTDTIHFWISTGNWIRKNI